MRASAVATVLILTGCSAAPLQPAQPSETTSAFPDAAGVDYQLGGSYPPPAGVGIVVRDSTAKPERGTYSVCYVNGFQTQPDDAARWAESDLVLRQSTGEPVKDPHWPDEFVLDIGTAVRRTSILDAMGPVIDRCRDAGFDAVELDNLDTYTRFPERIDRDAALAMAALYVDRGHRDGLAVGQKNSPDDAEAFATAAGFDFAVAEECAYFDECAAYTTAYGSRVIDVEYSDGLDGTFADVCHAPDRIAMTVLRDRLLVAPDQDGYVYARC